MKSPHPFAKPEHAVNWLRERAEINRVNAHIPPAQWEARVLPYIADRLEAAADEIERLRADNRFLEELVTSDSVHYGKDFRTRWRWVGGEDGYAGEALA